MRSWVDYRMPYRLMDSIDEIIRDYVKGQKFTASNSKFHIPAVFPIVLYKVITGYTKKDPRTFGERAFFRIVLPFACHF